MSTQQITPTSLEQESLLPNVKAALDPVAAAVMEGLTASPKWLPPWLFYDAEGSRLFEQITALPEYYPTRTERAIFSVHAEAIIDAALAGHSSVHGDAPGRKLRFLELGAGSASKTGILLAAAARRQGRTEYLPVDVSATAMEDACSGIARAVPDVEVYPQVANYVTDVLAVPPHDGPTLALYIGSSIGNFAPDEACAILQNLRAQLRPGDSLLLGTDLVKNTDTLLAAYDDSRGVTAAFNLNMLRRINLELDADFDLAAFQHIAVWNADLSRIEMHLRSTHSQTVSIAAVDTIVRFAASETIHTENSYKFTTGSVASLLAFSGFAVRETWSDEHRWFAVTMADVIR